jgi:hypothetical protein
LDELIDGVELLVNACETDWVAVLEEVRVRLFVRVWLAEGVCDLEVDSEADGVGCWDADPEAEALGDSDMLGLLLCVADTEGVVDLLADCDGLEVGESDGVLRCVPLEDCVVKPLGVLVVVGDGGRVMLWDELPVCEGDSVREALEVIVWLGLGLLLRLCEPLKGCDSLRVCEVLLDKEGVLVALNVSVCDWLDVGLWEAEVVTERDGVWLGLAENDCEALVVVVAVNVCVRLVLSDCVTEGAKLRLGVTVALRIADCEGVARADGLCVEELVADCEGDADADW